MASTKFEKQVARFSEGIKAGPADKRTDTINELKSEIAKLKSKKYKLQSRMSDDDGDGDLDGSPKQESRLDTTQERISTLEKILTNAGIDIAAVKDIAKKGLSSAKEDLSSAKLDKATLDHLLKLSRILDGDKINKAGLDAFRSGLSKNIQNNLDAIRSTNELGYFRMIVLIGEINTLYRDPTKNTQENSAFEELVSHINTKMGEELVNMSLSLDNLKLDECIAEYKKESNEDKKRLILDHLHEKYTSPKDKAIIEKSVGIDQVNDMLKYRETFEYDVYKKTPLFDGLTIENIFTQSPEKTQEAVDRISDTGVKGYLMLIGGVIGMAFLFLGPGSGVKGFFGRFLVMIGLGASIGAAQAMNPEADFLKDPLKAFMDFAQDGYDTKNDYTRTKSFAKIQQAALATNAGLGATEQLKTEKLQDMLDLFGKDKAFQAKSVSTIQDFVDGKPVSLRELFGDNIPHNVDGDPYTHEEIKKMLSILLATKDASDNNVFDLLKLDDAVTTAAGMDGAASLGSKTPKNPAGTAGTASLGSKTPKNPAGTAGTASLGSKTPKNPAGTAGTASLGSIAATKREKKETEEGFERLSKDRDTLRGYITQEGALYMIGDKGLPEAKSFSSLSPEYQKAVEKYPKLINGAQNLGFLLSALVKKDVAYKTLDQESQNALDNINGLTLDTDIPKAISAIEDIFARLSISGVDLYNRDDIVRYIYKDLDDSSLAKSDILANAFDNSDTSLGGIKDSDIEDFIEGRGSSSIESLLGSDEQSIRIKISKRKQEAESFLIKNREATDKMTHEHRLIYNEMVTNMFVGQYAESAILTSYIDRNGAGGNKQLEMFKKMEGIGWFTFADGTLENIAMELLAIGIGGLTGGAGYVGVKSLMYAYRGARLVNKLHTGSKMASTARFLGGAAVESAGFNLGHKLTQNHLLGENMSYEDGWTESFLSFIALKGASRVWKLIPKTGTLPKPLNITGEIGLTATALHTGQVILGEGDFWNLESIAQAIAMAAMVRGTQGASNMIFKNKNGRVEMHSQPATTKSATTASTSSTQTANAPKTALFNQNKAAMEKVHKLRKNSQITDIGTYKVQRLESGEFSVWKGAKKDAITYSTADDVVKAIGDKVATKSGLKQVMSVHSPRIDKVVKKGEFSAGDDLLRLQKSQNGYKLEKKVDGGWAQTKLSSENQNHINALWKKLDSVGAIGKIEKGLDKALATKLGDNLAEEAFEEVGEKLIASGVPKVKVPGILTKLKDAPLSIIFGPAANRVKEGLSYEGMKKAYILRNILTGKNSSDHWGSKIGGETSMLPQAWLPSGKYLGYGLAYTGTKAGIDYANGNEISGDITGDYMKIALGGPIIAGVWDFVLSNEMKDAGIELTKNGANATTDAAADIVSGIISS
ncbi:hypothetical protein OAN96_01135 [Candidatus Gracilibacteria bacterium]|nr:hypothetical protein [Candidatus Gracilibacteria bacterium]